MKHCQRAKHGTPTITLVKHVERDNFPMTLYRTAKNLLQRGKIWCNSVYYILWGRNGIHLGGVGAYLKIYEGGGGSICRELTKLGYIGWGHSPPPTMRNPVFQIW